MSMMRCWECEMAVDTDEDLDSLYVTGVDGRRLDGQCICVHCRDEDDDEAIDRFFFPREAE